MRGKNNLDKLPSWKEIFLQYSDCSLYSPRHTEFTYLFIGKPGEKKNNFPSINECPQLVIFPFETESKHPWFLNRDNLSLSAVFTAIYRKEECLQFWGELPPIASELKSPSLEISGEKSDNFTLNEWSQLIDKKLKDEFRAGLQKIVLHRQQSYSVKTGNLIHLKESFLAGRRPTDNLIWFQKDQQKVFAALSPETLFERNHDHLAIDVLAGSAESHQDPQQDEEIKNRLMNAPKEHEEFEFVRQEVTEVMNRASLKWEWQKEKSVLTLGYIHHLYAKASGTLKDDRQDKDLLKMIHPTPALGGRPRSKAVQMIREIETEDRGPYGAPVGIVSTKSSHFSVGIRSFSLDEQSLKLYSGAGITEQSIGEREYQETEVKFRKMSQVLGVKC